MTLFGSNRTTLTTRFVWLGDEQEAVTDDGFLTWYDARERHPARSEFRLYFPSNATSALAKEGDVIFIAKRTDATALIIITPSESTLQSQLMWLFALPDQPDLNFSAKQVVGDEGQIDFAARYILDEIGVEFEEPDAPDLDSFIEPFGLKFPTTKIFSEVAAKSLPEVNAVDDPDGAVVAWMEREEALFRRLERRVVEAKLKSGFVKGEAADVDSFIHFSLSVQNRRKSRAGYALEYHLARIFESHGIQFERGAATENKHKPDFLFPGGEQYQDPAFPTASLTMLGAKSSVKERWRQVLAEAERISSKHLMTLEPRISENQTDQMQAHQLQLIVPATVRETYKDKQKAWLWTVADFVKLVKERQHNP